jgi:hypothetical protein
MGARGFWELGHVSDQQLRQDLATLLSTGYRTEARIVAHLAELEDRKLHTKDASESLFAHCTGRLGSSNSEAFHRITVARLARQFPVIFELLERRELHLTAVCLLRDYLTAENHRELLAEAAHKTKWQVQELIARRFPRPDVASSVRKLPARSLPAPPLQPRLPARSLPARSLPAQVVGAGVPSAQSAAAPLLAAPLATFASVSPDAALAGASTVAEKRIASNAWVEPTSEARYRIQLNASSSLKEKLDQARALISHSNPSGDIAVVIERALDVLIEKVEKQRFGKTERPRRTRQARALRHDAARDGVTQAAAAEARKRRTSIVKDAPGGTGDEKREDSFVQTVQPKSLELAARRTDRKRGVKHLGLLGRSKAGQRAREHIPNATRREIAARDGLRCTFIGANGCRCEARAFLQIHHDEPWARGGGPEVENLRLLCASHNQLRAEQDFGRQHMASQVAARRSREEEKTNAGE